MASMQENLLLSFPKALPTGFRQRPLLWSPVSALVLQSARCCRWSLTGHSGADSSKGICGIFWSHSHSPGNDAVCTQWGLGAHSETLAWLTPESRDLDHLGWEDPYSRLTSQKKIKYSDHIMSSNQATELRVWHEDHWRNVGGGEFWKERGQCGIFWE